MAVHYGKVIEIGSQADGLNPVYYAHGSDSMRTYLGLSKFHITPHCRALLGKNVKKTLIKEWKSDLSQNGCCKVCEISESDEKCLVELGSTTN
jgi:hypothetical protein